MATEESVGSALANAHAGTASDFIMRTLIMEFREHTKKKLDDILKFGVADKVLLDEVFESDPKIQQQFNSLTNMSQYHPSIIVDSLLKWRRSQLAEITMMMASKDWKKMSKEELYLIEERIRLAVEYIFARALIPILDSLTFHKTALGTAFCEELEDIAFSFFKAPKKSEDDVEDDSVLGNRKKIPTLYAKVIGILSETRFKSIYPRFLRATTDTPARSKKAIFVILGIRYVRFMVETSEGIELSMSFLNSLLKLFKAAQPIEVKQAISELIVRLLRLSICSISPNCDYTGWYTLLNDLYASHAFHPKKGKSNKEAVALIPMVTSMLCSLSKPDFLEHYREWLSKLYNALKEYKTRTVALENILFVVEAFYLKVGNELQSALHLLLEEVGSIVLTYCTVKRPMAEKGDMLDIFVDMLHAMAQLSLSYTIEDVILKLLAFTNSPAATPDTVSTPTSTPSLTGSSFLPFAPFSSAPNPYAFACEKVIIAVRAIVQLRHGETSTNEKTSKRLFSMPSKDLLTIVYNHMVQATQAPVHVAPVTAASPKERETSKDGKDKDSHKDKDGTPKENPKELQKDSHKEVPPSKDSKDSKDSKSKSEKGDKDKLDKKEETKSAKDTTSPPPSIVVPPSPAPIPMPPFYSILASREAQLAALNPYWEVVTTTWAQILLHLDSVLGHLLYSTSYKTLYDMIKPERDIIAIQLLQLLLQTIPTVVPKIPIPRLVGILAKYIIHLDKGIEEMSTGALTRLLIWRPEFRPMIISGLADFATTLPHGRPDLVFTLLFKLGQLFKQWLEIIKPPFELPRGSHIPPSTAAELDNFPVIKIEGIALIFLCSPKSKIRLLALEILKSVRSVESMLRKDVSSSGPLSWTGSGTLGLSDAPLTPIRIMDIIDEAGPDIIRTLQSDSRYFSLQSISVTVKTVERLAAKDSREDQWLWSSVLGELLRHFSLLQPEPALLAAYLIQSRMREVKPDDKEIPLEQEEMVYWWRNYITLECVVLPPHFIQLLPPILSILGSSDTSHPPNLSGSRTSFVLPAGSSVGTSTSSGAQTIARELSTSSSSGSRAESLGSGATVMLPKDIFALVLPYLRSNNDTLRESSVLALQRVHFASAEVLSESMRSFEKEFQGDHSDKKRRQKRNRLRLEVTSIYASLVESIHQTAICRNPTLRRHLVQFVTELHHYLKSNRNLFDMLQLRYQYCVIVSRLAEELHAGTIASRDFQQSKEEIALRKNAFNLLSTWCSADIFQDEGTKKHLNSLLSPIKDGEKRKAYVNALREHIMVLQFSALTAMSSCLLGPHFEQILPGDGFFDFVDGFLRHPLDKVRLLARFMLESFLSGNIAQPQVLYVTLNKSYHVDTEIANQYFLCLVSLFPEDIIFACSEVVLLHLIVYMIGNADFHVRKAARELLLMLKSLTNSDEQWLTTVPFVVDSSLPENYERAQIDLSVRLADFHPDSAPEMITEMVIRLDTVSAPSKRQMLRSIVPWIEKLEFHTLPRQVLDPLMENMLFVTMRYKQDFPREVEHLWTTVARTNRNLQVVIRELITIGMQRQNTEIIPLAKFVCIYLARTASKVVIDTLVAELSAGELPLAGGSRRNTLTTSDRAAIASNGSARNGVSSLGGSQSNSQTSMPSYNADAHTEESESVPEIRERAKSDASHPERDVERPRSQTMGERLALPPKSRRESTGSREGRSSSPGTAGTAGVPPAANLLPARSSSTNEIATDAYQGHHPTRVQSKELDSKLMPIDTLAFTPVETPTAIKSRRRRRRRKNRSAVPNFSGIGSSDDEDSSGTSTSTFGVHPFQKLIPPLQAPWGLTRAHYILTILAQLTYETSEQFRDHLPVIFQLAFLGIDFPNPLVYEHCRIILLNVIHSLIVLPLEQIDNKTWALQEKYSEALHLVEYLRANQGEPLWAHEDVTMKKTEIRSAGQLTSLVQAIIKAFTPTQRGGAQNELAETWAAQALTWAVHGQSWHITGRSFQIYRALRPAITRDAQNDLLECLLRSLSISKSKRKSSSSKSGSTQTKENLALTIEVLITLQTLVRAQSAQKLILFPQMFWTAVALLQTDFEQHYLASLKLLSDLLDRLDFSDPYVQNIFSASVPKEWNPAFRGIQHLVARGLFSQMTEAKAIEVLGKLTLLTFDRVLHPEPGRLLHLITCLLPYVLSNMRNTSSAHGTSPKRQSAEIAAQLSQACTQHRLADLSRIFAKLSRFEYDTMEEFLIEFKRPFGNALVQLQKEHTPTPAPTATTPKSMRTSLTVSNPKGSTTNVSATTAATNSNTSTSLATSTTGSGNGVDDESSHSDTSDNKQYFRLESALSILFNVLEHSSSSWRRATLLIILSLLQHRYPPPQQPVQASQGGFVARMTSARDPTSSRVSSDMPRAGNSLGASSSDMPRLSIGSPPYDPLERVLQPSWLVTLLKQMSSSSWQQALLVLDLALQHSAITVSELDPFVLRTAKTTPTSANTSPGPSPGAPGMLNRERSDSGPHSRRSNAKDEAYFMNRSSLGVASASLALDKILSTEHRKRNLTLDSSLLSMFDGWYTKENTAAPAKSMRKKLSSVAELDSDIDESISTEDQISYLLQTDPKSSGTKSDPFDAISTPVPASTLGRFPTFRGFDELLSKLESMPSTPMATLDVKPTGLFPDSILDSSTAATSSTVVIRKSSSKKLKAPIKLNLGDMASSEATEPRTSIDDNPRSPRKVTRASSSLSSSDRSSNSYGSDTDTGAEVRRSNSYKFRMSLEPRSGASLRSAEADSQAESSANESESSVKFRTPSKSTSHRTSRKIPSSAGSDLGASGLSSAAPSTPPSSRKIGTSSSPKSPAPLSDPVPVRMVGSSATKAATFRPSSASRRGASPSNTTGAASGSGSVVKRSKTSTPISASSKYPSGVSDDQPTSPIGSSRLKKLEFSFSSELLTRTKRWRAVLNREPSTEVPTEDLPAYFKVFSSAAKLLTSIRADFRSCLTFYCRLVIPTNRSWMGSEKSTYDPGAPHRALSDLLGRMTPELDHVIPKIPELMLGMLPLKYKRVLKRDLAFASGFRDQRTKFIDEVKQCHLSYTEQRVAVENIKSSLQDLERIIFEDEGASAESGDQSLQADKLAMEFAIAVLQLHIVVLSTLQVQISVGPMMAPLLESYSSELAAASKETVENEVAKSRALLQNLQHNLLTLN